MNTSKGKYLFNSNETIEVYFKDGILKIKWRGKNLKPIKVNDSSFYVKEINEKLVFMSKPEMHIELAEKREHKGEKFYFKKIAQEEKTALEYFKNKEYTNALNAYIKIQQNDSLDPVIDLYRLNSMANKYIRANKIVEAKELILINIALYPQKSLVYDSMGDAFKKENDTVKAIEYYKKSLVINPENRNSLRNLEKLKRIQK
jgi:tetratricopeptide (TPR) repeat protein|tara:strand:+ start:14406 stop:15011 length:606 start_codon:yes stop_codon:yes gene_type:complete